MNSMEVIYTHQAYQYEPVACMLSLLSQTLVGQETPAVYKCDQAIIGVLHTFLRHQADTTATLLRHRKLSLLYPHRWFQPKTLIPICCITSASQYGRESVCCIFCCIWRVLRQNACVPKRKLQFPYSSISSLSKLRCNIWVCQVLIVTLHYAQPHIDTSSAKRLLIDYIRLIHRFQN